MLHYSCFSLASGIPGGSLDYVFMVNIEKGNLDSGVSRVLILFHFPKCNILNLLKISGFDIKP